MNMPFEILEIDWSNPDVQKVVDFFGEKYKQKHKKVAELSTANAELYKRIVQLEETIAQMQTER